MSLKWHLIVTNFGWWVPWIPILDLWPGWDSDTHANICIWHFFSLLNEFIFSNPQCHVQGGNEDYSFNNLWLQYLLNFSPYWQYFTYRHHISAKHWQYQFTLATVLLHCFLRIGIFTSILNIPVWVKKNWISVQSVLQSTIFWWKIWFPSFGLYSGFWLKQQIQWCIHVTPNLPIHPTLSPLLYLITLKWSFFWWKP